MQDKNMGIATLLHITSAVFMAWPLYALITVNERPKVGASLGDKVDDFMESIIKKQAGRCYIFQITALITGLYLWSYGKFGFSLSAANLFMFGKLLGLLILMGLLSYVVFVVQPKIDTLFGLLKERAKNKEEITSKIIMLRVERKKFAATCLFVLLVIIIFAVQIREPLSLFINIILLSVAALFSVRVYKTNIPYGWV